MPLLLGFLLWGCGGGAPSVPTDLAPVPHPSTEAMEPIVQEQIAKGKQELEEALAGRRDEGELAEKLGNLGLTYHAYDLAPAALACYENARRLQPSEKLWPYAAGRLQLETLGELAAAEASFERALELDPRALPPRLYLGKTLLALQRPEEAAEQFRRVLEEAPGSAAAFDGLGRAAADLGAQEEAAGYFRKALELQPGAERIYYRLGQALRRAGRSDEARQALARQGPAEVAFRDQLQEELAGRARGVAAAVRWGGVAQLAGDLEGALKAFRHAVSLDPDDPAARQSLGGVLAQQGDTAGAVEQYRRAAALEPANATHPYNLGQLLLRTGRLGEAEEALRGALELDPSFLDAHLTLASIFEQQGRFDAALTEYDRVLATDPAHLQARTWRGVAFARMGDEERALEELEALVAAAPGFAQARLQLGILLARRARWEAARGHLEEVLRLDPPAKVREGTREGLRALGQALAREGEYTAAAGIYRSVIEAEDADAAGADGPTRLAEATALVLAGRYPEARQRLEEGLARLPSDTALAHALARLLAAAPDPSVRARERALELAQGVHDSLGSLDSAETLAMALAANGRYAEAARLQRQILDGAASLGNPALMEHLRGNLERYEKNQPPADPFRR